MKTMVSHPSKHPPMDWVAFALLLVVSATNLFSMLRLIPIFQRIYNDLFGEKLLPPITSFILHWRFLFVSLAFLWPAIGIFIVYFSTNRNAIRFVLGLILATLIQIGFTVIALFLPLVVDI